MVSSELPYITITTPDGQQEPVVIFGMPAAEDELAPLWQLLEEDEPVSAPSLAPEHAAQVDSSSSFDIDNATMDKIWARIDSQHEAMVTEARQAKEDSAYSALSDTVSDFKTLRVASQGFVPFRCRMCGKEYPQLAQLCRHLGNKGKQANHCRVYFDLLKERENVDSEQIVEPAQKKQKI
ncbi:hypothetical protein CEP52_007841 [Fusarium oligoseptatum]|uniref:C2H2-type domain-containing protein n=1 Tax=Fusarium oligoseptatum TaxID=2604345 RepID=A0A428TKP3_9HYPO|nr:hypothetical protein CEP52_007841 [Fusarium oligoseptatum]